MNDYKFILKVFNAYSAHRIERVDSYMTLLHIYDYLGICAPTHAVREAQKECYIILNKYIERHENKSWWQRLICP